jgi:hypothetical protein
MKPGAFCNLCRPFVLLLSILLFIGGGSVYRVEFCLLSSAKRRFLSHHTTPKAYLKIIKDEFPFCLTADSNGYVHYETSFYLFAAEILALWARSETIGYALWAGSWIPIFIYFNDRCCSLSPKPCDVLIEDYSGRVNHLLFHAFAKL